MTTDITATTPDICRKDIECEIARDLERAKAHKSRENRERWVLALIASRTVGRRIPGLTVELARICGLTAPDAVEHWAKAWRMYRILKRVTGRWNANVLRRELTVSHFYVIFDLGHKYKMSIMEIETYLMLMLDNKAVREERWSVDVLRTEVSADYPDGKAVDWRYHWTRLRRPLEQLASFDGELPDEIKRGILELLALFDEKYYDVV